ncbi:MAG: GNAT family N-acetyltransferase [Phycisphaerales bacterium]|nr:GNAT family N-acetyltransferase [Phycisphaerales bacterium]
MGAEPPRWSIEALASDHDRDGFSCGHASLDEFLKRYAGQNQRTGVSRTFVAVRPGERVVCGFYSLAAGSVELNHLTDEQRKRLPRYPVPVAHLGRLAVDRGSQGKRLGETLLIDGLWRIARADREIGIHAVEVVAIDEAARRFYLKYGFSELRDDPRHMFISMKTVRKLGVV